MKPERRYSYQSSSAPHGNTKLYRLCCVAQPILRDGWCWWRFRWIMSGKRPRKVKRQEVVASDMLLAVVLAPLPRYPND
jgi:hypothetical protein